jgi:transposase
MLGLSPATRVYVATGAVDMRKGFEGLFGIVRDTLCLDPLSGHLFLFANKNRTRLRVLFWDGSGFWVCANVRATAIELTSGGISLAALSARRFRTSRRGVGR